MKSVRRNNPRAAQLRALRRATLPASVPAPQPPPHDRLGSTEARIRKEIAIMKKLHHAHVVRLYEIIDDRLREKIYIGASLSALGARARVDPCSDGISRGRRGQVARRELPPCAHPRSEPSHTARHRSRS